MFTTLLILLFGIAVCNLFLFGGSMILSVVLLILALGLLTVRIFLEKKIPPVALKITYPVGVCLFFLLAIMTSVNISNQSPVMIERYQEDGQSYAVNNAKNNLYALQRIDQVDSTADLTKLKLGVADTVDLIQKVVILGSADCSVNLQDRDVYYGGLQDRKLACVGIVEFPLMRNLNGVSEFSMEQWKNMVGSGLFIELTSDNRKAVRQLKDADDFTNRYFKEMLKAYEERYTEGKYAAQQAWEDAVCETRPVNGAGMY